MDESVQYQIVNKEKFLAEYESLRPIILGKGKIIASKAEVAYHTYRNAVSGKINNPAILGSILWACRIVHLDVIAKYSKSLPIDDDEEH